MRRFLWCESCAGGHLADLRERLAAVRRNTRYVIEHRGEARPGRRCDSCQVPLTGVPACAATVAEQGQQVLPWHHEVLR